MTAAAAPLLRVDQSWRSVEIPELSSRLDRRGAVLVLTVPRSRSLISLYWPAGGPGQPATPKPKPSKSAHTARAQASASLSLLFWGGPQQLRLQSIEAKSEPNPGSSSKLVPRPAPTLGAARMAAAGGIQLPISQMRTCTCTCCSTSQRKGARAERPRAT